MKKRVKGSLSRILSRAPDCVSVSDFNDETGDKIHEGVFQGVVGGWRFVRSK